MSTFRSTTVPADVFRPISSESSPVLLTYGPYAKGLPFQQDYLRKPEVDSVKLPWFD
jgi:predicted acyl esterase